MTDETELVKDTIKMVPSLLGFLNTLLIVVAIWQVTSFGNTLIQNMSVVNDNIGTLVGKVTQVGEGLASDEFAQKADTATTAIADVKKNMLDKWKKASE